MLRTVHVRTIFPSGAGRSGVALHAESGRGDAGRSLFVVARHASAAEQVVRAVATAFHTGSLSEREPAPEVLRRRIEEIENRSGAGADVAAAVVLPPYLVGLTRGAGVLGLDRGNGLRLSSEGGPRGEELDLIPDGTGWRHGRAVPELGQHFMLTLGDQLAGLRDSDVAALRGLLDRASRPAPAARLATELSSAGGALILGRFNHLPWRRVVAPSSPGRRSRGATALWPHRTLGIAALMAALVAFLGLARLGGMGSDAVPAFGATDRSLVDAHWTPPSTAGWRCRLPAMARGRPVPLGDVVVAACDDAMARVVDPVSGAVVGDLDLAPLEADWITPLAGNLFVSGADGGVSVLDPRSGRRLWRTRLGSGVSDLVADQGRLWLIAGRDAVCLDAETGEIAWRTPIGEEPLLGLDVARGIGVVADRSGELIGFDPATGETRWRVSLPGPPEAAPVVLRGNVYVATRTGDLACYHVRRGEHRWTTSLGAAPRTGLLVGGEDLYCATSAGEIVAADPATGRIRWRHRGRNLEVSDLVLDGGYVLALERSGRLLALVAESGEPAGERRFQAEPGGGMLVFAGRAIAITRAGGLEAVVLRERRGA